MLLLGSWGKGYRAPLLLELFEAQVETLGIGSEDPLRCPVTELLSDCGFGGRTRSGGNPSLVPERSTRYADPRGRTYYAAVRYTFR